MRVRGCWCFIAATRSGTATAVVKGVGAFATCSPSLLLTFFKQVPRHENRPILLCLNLSYLPKNELSKTGFSQKPL